MNRFAFNLAKRAVTVANRQPFSAIARSHKEDEEEAARHERANRARSSRESGRKAASLRKRALPEAPPRDLAALVEKHRANQDRVPNKSDPAVSRLNTLLRRYGLPAAGGFAVGRLAPPSLTALSSLPVGLLLLDAYLNNPGRLPQLAGQAGSYALGALGGGLLRRRAELAEREER